MSKNALRSRAKSTEGAIFTNADETKQKRGAKRRKERRQARLLRIMMRKNKKKDDTILLVSPFFVADMWV